jgi:hypothetical protein
MEPLVLTETVKCNNCCCDSHCGNDSKRTEKHYPVDGGKQYEIEVCKQCRCDACA